MSTRSIFPTSRDIDGMAIIGTTPNAIRGLRYADGDPEPTDPAPTDPAPTDPAPTDPAPTDPKPGPPADPKPGDPAPVDIKEGDVSALPKWARDSIAKANKQAATSREEKNNALAVAYKKIGIDLGVVQADEKDLTPEQLADRLTGENTTLKDENKSLKTKLTATTRRDAIKAAADAESGDVSLLVPYLNGLDSFQALDTDAEDYAAQVAEIVKAEVTKNPKLKAVPVAPSSTVDTPPNGDPAPVKTEGVEAAREARRKRRNGS